MQQPQPRDLVAIPEAFISIAPVVRTLLLTLAPSSQVTYAKDIKHFLAWLATQNLHPATLTYSDLVEYQALLLARYAKAGAARRMTVVRRLLKEILRGSGHPNPAEELPKITVSDESPHVALTRPEARDLLRAIDRSTILGKRNYAIIKLLVRTGLRRSECAALNIGDLAREQGHIVATIHHGKGDKRRKVKIPIDVLRAIEEYIAAAKRQNAAPGAPLFVQMRKGDRVQEGARISDKVIERLVAELAAEIGEPALSPHGLRATFVTLALEGGASLHQTQYAAGHSDPRTTERYQKRKLNLDDNAVDYVRIDA